MKSVLFLVALSVVTAVVRGSAIGLEPRTKGGYLQKNRGNSTFTVYTGCSTPGKHCKLYIAQDRKHQLWNSCSVWKSFLRLHRRHKPAFIWCPWERRCRGRMWTLLQDYWYQGSVHAIVFWSVLQHRCEGHQSMPIPRRRELVRSVAFPPSQSIWRACAVSDGPLTPQFLSFLTKLRGSFDLCEESGAYSAFFPEGRGALSGHYEEVSCSQWSGWDGQALWNGACLASESTGLWPKVGCGNTGMGPSLGLHRVKYSSHMLQVMHQLERVGGDIKMLHCRTERLVGTHVANRRLPKKTI
jgi:hypothetical protein